MTIESLLLSFSLFVFFKKQMGGIQKEVLGSCSVWCEKSCRRLQRISDALFLSSLLFDLWINDAKKGGVAVIIPFEVQVSFRPYSIQ